MEKKSRFDRLRQKMAEVEEVGPRSNLPSPKVLTAAAGAKASTPAAMVRHSSSSSATKAKKKSLVTSSENSFSLEREEGVKEDPSADLRQKKWKRKVQESFPEERLLGLMLRGSVREALGLVVPEQRLGTAQQYTYKLIACLQVGMENAFSAKLKMEKELAASKDQVVVLTAERDSSLTSPPLKVEVDTLAEKMRLAEGERLYALARMLEVEERSKVQAVEFCFGAGKEEGRISHQISGEKADGFGRG
ncbi:hypothetical protein PIB30_073839 [Stylosanthes scabra]|uniref:Uncharacterized protein n=1 Tax=Stylosanthes scabra TaxID=79078 RepID=A0ABU6UNU4_9FABA|nr:hypothetical protein [Stylosanthes scabra]